MSQPMPDFSGMHREHEAWLAIVREMKRIDLDLNEQDALHAAIVLWGEELVALRMTQGSESIEKAREEALRKFNAEIGFTSY